MLQLLLRVVPMLLLLCDCPIAAFRRVSGSRGVGQRLEMGRSVAVRHQTCVIWIEVVLVIVTMMASLVVVMILIVVEARRAIQIRIT